MSQTVTPRRSRGAHDLRPGAYGMDAPRVIGWYAVAGILGVLCVVISAVTPANLWGLGLVLAAVGGFTSLAMLHSSVRGKVVLRGRVLNRLRCGGPDDVLDLGCGGGLMLLGAAARCPDGVATGIDLWHGADQARSSPARCRANAATLGLQGRIRLLTGDMSDLPLADGSVDIVLACMSIHNIHDPRLRGRTIAQAARVLRPAGRLAIIDFAHTGEYAAAAVAAGLTEVTRSSPSLLMWPPVRIVTAQKPLNAAEDCRAPATPGDGWP